jgi:hypothetical protein
MPIAVAHSAYVGPVTGDVPHSSARPGARPRATLDDGQRRRLAAVLWVAAAVVICYWVAWFTHRSLVASEALPAYQQFEDAFPLADAWLVVCLVGAAVTVRARRPSALLFLLAGSGAGLYLFCMDVLYDLQHGIWGKGANGLVELAVNIVTLVLSVGVLRFTWRHREALLAG